MNQLRFWPLITALLLGTSFPCVECCGQVMLSPAFEDSQQPEQEPSSESIAISGQAINEPLLRHRFWPAPELRRQRNAMVAVNRAIILAGQVPAKNKRQFLQQYESWSQLPFDQLPIEDAKALLLPFELAIRELRRGENWMNVSYDLATENLSVNEKLAVVLPEYQQTRDLARLLCLRARVAVAERRWQDAVADLRLGFRLAEITAHSNDLLICRLIGCAIARATMETIHDMIQLPDCPNLYWGIVSIPIDRITEMRRAVEAETILAAHAGKLIGDDKLSDELIGEDAAWTQLVEFETMFRSADLAAPGADGSSAPFKLIARGLALSSQVQAARSVLQTSERWNSRLSELSEAETILRASAIELERTQQRWQAWALLPPELWKGYENERRTALTLGEQRVAAGANLARSFLPNVQHVLMVRQTVQQQHHRLATIEAIRASASSDGSLPSSLDHLKPVPAWQDPLTGEPFHYSKTSSTGALLIRKTAERDENPPILEITLRVQP